MPNSIIKFNHEEVEALLQLINDVENDKIADGATTPLLTASEASAKEKLKKIYARQILSHERSRDGLRNMLR